MEEGTNLSAARGKRKSRRSDDSITVHGGRRLSHRRVRAHYDFYVHIRSMATRGGAGDGFEGLLTETLGDQCFPRHGGAMRSAFRRGEEDLASIARRNLAKADQK